MESMKVQNLRFMISNHDVISSYTHFWSKYYLSQSWFFLDLLVLFIFSLSYCVLHHIPKLRILMFVFLTWLVFFYDFVLQLRCTYRAYDAMDEITSAFSIAFNPTGTKYSLW